ncbi:MAG: hypothetical protein ACRD4P_15550, partial [Bryobacteraceae bacterium]
MTPEELSADLREGESAALVNRRSSAGLSFLSMASLGCSIRLASFGIFRRLFDAAKRLDQLRHSTT